MYKSLLLSIILAASCKIVLATRSDNRNSSRCFQFTWLGPRYTNESIFLNATCQLATNLYDKVPCQMPLVVSYDGTWPDVEYIWTHHSEQASCTLADNDVCAKYTFYFNGLAENSTYMCTRAINSNNTAITSGCYEEIKGSYATKVCFCRSLPGGVPCNAASVISVLPMLFFILATILIISNEFTLLNLKLI
ncbi:uncharacterized protein LOC126781749 [Nymphalis io]|uniref:uncharacterized protein LOC126781749 n=1 Tax=Inachis io TaxID=171585 RepID=UPI0021693C6A|nr:uncharacterized protein LOC126781749 [Nymphalis io]